MSPLGLFNTIKVYSMWWINCVCRHMDWTFIRHLNVILNKWGLRIALYSIWDVFLECQRVVLVTSSAPYAKLWLFSFKKEKKKRSSVNNSFKGKFSFFLKSKGVAIVSMTAKRTIDSVWGKVPASLKIAAVWRNEHRIIWSFPLGFLCRSVYQALL